MELRIPQCSTNDGGECGSYIWGRCALVVATVILYTWKVPNHWIHRLAFWSTSFEHKCHCAKQNGSQTCRLCTHPMDHVGPQHHSGVSHDTGLTCHENSPSWSLDVRLIFIYCPGNVCMGILSMTNLSQAEGHLSILHTQLNIQVNLCIACICTNSPCLSLHVLQGPCLQHMTHHFVIWGGLLPVAPSPPCWMLNSSVFILMDGNQDVFGKVQCNIVIPPLTKPVAHHFCHISCNLLISSHLDCVWGLNPCLHCCLVIILCLSPPMKHVITDPKPIPYVLNLTSTSLLR